MKTEDGGRDGKHLEGGIDQAAPAHPGSLLPRVSHKMFLGPSLDQFRRAESRHGM